MENTGEDDQTNSAGARPTAENLQQEQEWWNQRHVPSHQVGEQERSEQGPASADSSETPGQSVQPSPPMPMQLMNTPVTLENIRKAMCLTICGIGGMMINNGSGCKFNPRTMLTRGTSMGLWHPALDINSVTVGISGIARMPMIGINGHLGLHEVMMMGGRRGHSGKVNRRSASTSGMGWKSS